MTQSTDTTHACPGGCGARVARSLYACRPCWYRLPIKIRNAISGNWRARDMAAHSEAMRAARAWYRENP